MGSKMTKLSKKNNIDFEDDYDVLDDIQPEDYIIVISGEGTLRGISLPENLADEDDINIIVEEVIKLLLKKNKEMTVNKTLH